MTELKSMRVRVRSLIDTHMLLNMRLGVLFNDVFTYEATYSLAYVDLLLHSLFCSLILYKIGYFCKSFLQMQSPLLGIYGLPCFPVKIDIHASP